jgi:twitching motility protein PilJ
VLTLQSQALDSNRALMATIPELIKTLEAPPKHALTLPPPSLRVLKDLWRLSIGQVIALNAQVPKLKKLLADAQRLQNVSNSLMVISDSVVDALVVAEAPLQQIRVASRQLMLLQRMSANLRRLSEPDSDLLVAVDRLGRDAVVFGDVTTGLLNGNPELGIERVADTNAREILVSAGRDFRSLVQFVEAVIGGAEARSQLQLAALKLGPTLKVLDTQSRFLQQRLRQRDQDRFVQPGHVLLLMGLTCISVLSSLILGFNDRRARTQQWRDAHQQWDEERVQIEDQRRTVDEELEGLARQIHRLADGELGLGGSGSKLRGPAASLAWSGLERLRQRLHEHTDSGLRIAQAGKLANDMASRLHDVSRQQHQQIEDSGRATQVMAAAMEALSSETGAVSDALRDSENRAGQASQTLNETLQELSAAEASVEDSAERVRRLEDAARQLRSLQDLIEDVSELGKLLSLNVAIQASVDSPASQALAGFSTEVSRLAARARSAQVRIESVDAELRSEAARAASSVKESVWRTRGAAQRARSAQSAVEDMGRATHSLEVLNRNLAKSYREHAVNVTEVVRAVTGLHGISAQVSEKITASLEASGTLAESATRLEHRLGGGAEDPNPVLSFGQTNDSDQDLDSTPNPVEERPHRRLKLWT